VIFASKTPSICKHTLKLESLSRFQVVVQHTFVVVISNGSPLLSAVIINVKISSWKCNESLLQAKKSKFAEGPKM
jgi:hypothetical protein